MNNADKPAMPTVDTDPDGSYTDSIGLTKLEYFTAAALTGICADPERGCWPCKEIAKEAINQAKAALKLLEEETGR